MKKKSKTFLEEFPITIVFGIGMSFLFARLYSGFWMTILGLGIGLVIGFFVDALRDKNS